MVAAHQSRYHLAHNLKVLVAFYLVSCRISGANAPSPELSLLIQYLHKQVYEHEKKKKAEAAAKLAQVRVNVVIKI